jgi:hypothetical protein
MLLSFHSVLQATTLTEQSSEAIEDGVTLIKYRASSPSTDVYVLRIDLCVDNIYMDATIDADSYQTTGSWGSDMDFTAATNGDFYKTDPTRVYGDAYGSGIRWPSGHTGWDSSYSSEWYYEHYGWIAFGHDEVYFSHTGWVKTNISGLQYGIDNSDLTPAPPKGIISMVSGFPELVVEGSPVVCADPEDSSCFPDRSDMRDRHPRTAMGITEDLQTFLLVVADGRTSDNDGLYGSELADIMGQLGAWEAFNLDGGGSSQLWTKTDGYINDYDGNNSGGGARSVANHWGIFAGGRSYLAARPGHCVSSPSCGSLPPGGGIIDDTSACYRGFGDQDYWRDESVGYGGSLKWTNAFESDQPDNWAWWRVELEEAGEYEVFVYATPEYSVFDDVEYEVRANGTTSTLRVDPSGQAGWVSIGTWFFAEGGEQWVAFFDNQDHSPESDQHIAADAVSLVRVGSWCGDGVCDSGEECGCTDCPVGEEIPGNSIDDDCDGQIDEATPSESVPAESNPEPESAAGMDSTPGLKGSVIPLKEEGCSCKNASSSWGALLGLGLLLRGRAARNSS